MNEHGTLTIPAQVTLAPPRIVLDLGSIVLKSDALADAISASANPANLTDDELKAIADRLNAVKLLLLQAFGVPLGPDYARKCATLLRTGGNADGR